MSDMVFRFPAPGPDPMVTDLEGWTKIDGNPTMKTWVQHTSADGSVISGTWEATTGTWHASYKFYEFVHLIDGQITITPDGGTPVTLHPGDVVSTGTPPGVGMGMKPQAVYLKKGDVVELAVQGLGQQKQDVIAD